MIPFRHSKAKRRWSLFLVVAILLHATFGACSAIADTLCLEASGLIVLEQSGHPCAAKAQGDKSCVDLLLHDDHASVQCKMKLVSADAPGLVSAIRWLPQAVPTNLAISGVTTSPVPILALIVRRTLYLLI